MRSLPLSLALLVSLSVTASAFELVGGTATLEWRNGQGAERQTHFTGGVELSLGAGFSTQLSVKNTNYRDEDPANNFGSFGYELHAIWRPQAEGLALGVFTGREDFDPWYGYQGIEAKYDAGSFSAEAAVSDYSGPGYDARHMTLELGYQINDRFGVVAGYSTLKQDGVNDTAKISYIGATAKVADGFSLFGKYSDVRGSGFEYGDVEVGIRFDFGNGVTFHQRSYSEIFPEG